ncbi:LAETG motif-containing sortase-dependent surface protein [Kitasatospora sp. NPDC050543]|uniref:LAETG motif-containing sortase-dependent surface protein n=1 Tax=Kitasatospora sp. NPDC050543 TaxID=3364054 RepID=UPI003798F6FA
MNVRRSLATAAIAAAITPAVLLSATPALADTAPTGQSQPDGTSVAQLEKAAADADKAYQDAVATAAKERKLVSDLLDNRDGIFDRTYKDIVDAATKAAEARQTAKTAKTAADKALADEQATANRILDSSTSTEDERVAALTALYKAHKAADAADAALTAAEAKADATRTAEDDVRVAIARKMVRSDLSVTAALAAKNAADQALTDAKAQAKADAEAAAAAAEKAKEQAKEQASATPVSSPTTLPTALPTAAVVPAAANARAGAPAVAPVTAPGRTGTSTSVTGASTTAETATGVLADTGASPATPYLAAAAGAAVVLGAGAVYASRRRQGDRTV